MTIRPSHRFAALTRGSLGARTVLVAATTALLASSGCATDPQILNVSKADPDYGTIFKPGINKREDRYYSCKYKDPRVVRTATLPVPDAPADGIRLVDPGLAETSRGEVAGRAKQAAIRTLRRNAYSFHSTFTQIESCDLECVEIQRPNQAEAGGFADASAAPPSPGSGASRGGDSAEGAQETSTTNNQVSGVDEADFVKNDNKYMYVASDQKVAIIEAWPAATARTLSTFTPTKGKPTKLFLGNDKLVVYSTVGSAGGTAECTYGYDCVPTGDGSSTHVTVVDIRDRTRPRIEREYDLSGSFIAARKIGNAIHTVVYDGPIEERLNALTRPPQVDEGCLDRRDDLDAKVQTYTDAVDAAAKHIEELSESGPTLTAGGEPVESTFRASNMPGESFLSVVSFGLDGDTPKAETLVSKPGFVYASSSALYVSVPHWKNEPGGCWYGGRGNDSQASEVYRFAIGASPSATRFEASGIVKGTVLNQFAMDEWGGNLRIATTSGRTPDPRVHSTVTVLEKNGPNLTQRGIVDNIAPTEDIRSVRFDGDRGFVVTFKKTDPLFAIDLSNPAAPRITGELKIPGFSTYMHFMDRTHILAMGLEADDHGDFAYFDGIQLQIFDINDMSRPTLLHKTVIGTRGSASEALTNHLGFNYFAPKNLLALPMTVCEGGGDGRYGDRMTFNGLMVFGVTVQEGFTKKGGIAHPVASRVSCNNWWTSARSTVKRSVIMDDFVYSIADDAVIVANVATLDAPVSTIALP